MSERHSNKVFRDCESCGTKFETRLDKIQLGYGRFCSLACRTAPTPAIPLIDRFFRYVGRKEPNGCILWTGNAHKSGYGMISIGGGKNRRTLTASRVSYELFVGPIPSGIFVCHTCDTPACICPTHLWLGTNADNVADRVAKGRGASGSPKFTEDSIRQLRLRYSQGGVEMKQLAYEHKVNPSTISLIINRKTWKHVS